MSVAETQQGFPRISAPLCNADLTCNQIWLQFFIGMWNRTGSGAGASTIDAIDLAAFGESAPFPQDSLPEGGGGGVLEALGAPNFGLLAPADALTAVLADPLIPPYDPLTALLAESAPLAGATGAATGVTPGTYGDGTHVGQFTVNATGDLTFAGNVAITAGGSGTVTNVATGTGLTGGPITTTGTIALANTAVTPATYGDATHVAQFTVDQQGRLTFAGNVVISPTGDINPFSDGGITKPVAASFTIADDTTAGHGTGTVTNLASRGVELTETHGSGGSTQSWYFESAVSNTLVSTVAYISPNFQDLGSNWFYGLGVRDNTGKIHAFGLRNSGANGSIYSDFRYTNISTLSSATNQTGGQLIDGRPVWFKLAKVSTNFVFSVSMNGETYQTIETVSATAFVGATLNDVGFLLVNNLGATSATLVLDVFSFTVT